jgi:hypothetical protein
MVGVGVEPNATLRSLRSVVNLRITDWGKGAWKRRKLYVPRKDRGSFLRSRGELT